MNIRYELAPLIELNLTHKPPPPPSPATKPPLPLNISQKKFEI